MEGVLLKDLASGAIEAAGMDLPAMGETASGKPWRLRAADRRAALAIAQKADIELPVARALAARGVSPETVESYLRPSLRESLPDPFALADMATATARLAAAVREGETVGVFGDYDVDGTTAASLLKLYFEEIGAPLLVHLPDRIVEGYGPSIEAFRDLARRGAKVIVTVDCGAAAHDVIEKAAAEGLDVIVFDHHQMNGPPPAGAVATVNPNREDDVSGLTNLSAAGVAFMGLVALNRALREAGYFNGRPAPDLLRYLDLVALGLVCDVMEMRGLARVFVARGLDVLARGGNPGLKALAARAVVKGRPSTYHLGFILGPRINAAGRIGHARLALELLTTDDPVRRAALAEKLHILNAERQEIEAAVLADATAMAAQQADRSVIVVSGQNWHPGVIGIVAGRLKEAFDKPAVVISIEGDKGKGSGRSISGVDLGAAIAAAREAGHLTAGGGHAMAAGLSISGDRIEAFATFMNDRLSTDILAAQAARRIDIDAVVAASAAAKPLADMIAAAGPFGPGNPEPVLVVADMRVSGTRIVGSGHVSCTLKSDAGEPVRAIAFRAAETRLGEMLAAGGRVHVAGKIRADEWRGGAAAQLHIVDVAAALGPA